MEDITLISCSRHPSVTWMSVWEQPGGRWAQWRRLGERSGEVRHQLWFGYVAVHRGGVVLQPPHAVARVSPVELL